MIKPFALLFSFMTLVGCSGSPDRSVPNDSKAARTFVQEGFDFRRGARFEVRHVRIRKVGNKESFSEQEVIRMYDALRSKMKRSVLPQALNQCETKRQRDEKSRPPIYFLDVYMQAEIFSRGKLNRQRALSLAIWPFSEAIIDREYLRVDLRMFDGKGNLVAGYDMGERGAQSWSNLLGLDAAAEAGRRAVTTLCEKVRDQTG